MACLIVFIGEERTAVVVLWNARAASGGEGRTQVAPDECQSAHADQHRAAQTLISWVGDLFVVTQNMTGTLSSVAPPVRYEAAIVERRNVSSGPAIWTAEAAVDLVRVREQLRNLDCFVSRQCVFSPAEQRALRGVQTIAHWSITRTTDAAETLGPGTPIERHSLS